MGRRIIIVEDEPLIALDIEQAVLEAGCLVAGMAHSLADARALIDTAEIHGAILDTNLGGESVEPLLDRLKSDNIPFLIVSGYSPEQLGFVDDDTALVGKPFALRHLTASIRARFLDDKG